MKHFYLLLIIASLYQTGFSQINLTIDANRITPMKLSDISAQSYSVAMKMDNDTFSYFISDDYLFITKRLSLGKNSTLHQFDFSGKLIRVIFGSNRPNGRIFCDVKSNKLLFDNLDGNITFWDFNGVFLKEVKIPEKAPLGVIGFEQNNVWLILRSRHDDEKVNYRICRLNYETEQLEVIMERVFPLGGVFSNACYSSFGGKSFVGFHDNVFYEVVGKNVRPAVKYNIRNFTEDPTYYTNAKIFAGRFFTMKYGNKLADRLLYWYDTKEKRSWQVREFMWKGGIEDDIFRTGTCDDYQIFGDYLVFTKRGDNLPKEMNKNADPNLNVFFIIKLKQ